MIMAVKVNRLTVFCIVESGREQPRHSGSADTLRHFNQDHVERWTTATGLAISHVTGSRGMGRKSDPFGVQITLHACRKQQRSQLTGPPCPSLCVSASPPL